MQRIQKIVEIRKLQYALKLEGGLWCYLSQDGSCWRKLMDIVKYRKVRERG